MPNTITEPIRLFVLGESRIETPGGSIEPSSEFVFAAALYLILEGEEPVARRSIEAILWPGIDRKVASHRLRQTLLKLRKLGIPVVAVGKTRLSLPREATSIDYRKLLESPLRLEETSPGRFVVLPDYEPVFSSSFLEWLDVRKRMIVSQMTFALLTIVARQRKMGNWEAVDSWATSLLQLTPYNEEATLALAEAHAMRGSKLQADELLATYLAEIGDGRADLRLPAAIMRKRIADRMPPRAHANAGETPLIGRGETINSLADMLPIVRSGRGRAFLVSGDPGIGKSRLLAEFSNFASLQGLGIVRVQCRLSDPYRPLSVFVDLVPMLRGMRGAIGCSPETMKHLDRLTTHRSVRISPIALQGDAEFVYARIQQALFDLIDAVSDESPLLILIEDIQRLDEVSAALLADILPWSGDRPIMFAFTGRSGHYEWLESLGDMVQHIKLNPLDATSSRDLILGSVRQCGREITEEYLRWCVRIADGNPYFLTELANHWIQTGEREEAPPSLTAVINQRLQRLDTPTLQLLQTCSLLDKASSLERIEKVLGYPQHKLLECISTLSALGMIVLEQTDVGSDRVARLAPKHELLANAAESSLAPPAKAFLHRRIGIVLESESNDSKSSALLWDCAKHWQQAGNQERAFVVARSCANHLMELGLCGAAAEGYEKTLAFCTSDAQRLEILEGQTEAYFRASDWQNLSVAASKVRIFQRHSQPNEHVHDDIELMDIRAQWQRGGQADMLERTLECLRCHEATNEHRCRAGIMALMLLDLACDFPAMQDTYNILRPLVELPDCDVSHRFEAGMVFETVCGDLSSALPLAESLVAARRHSHSVADLIRALTNAATVARTAGEFELSTTWLSEAIGLAESHKLPLATEIPIQILASMALDQDNVTEASLWYGRLLELSKSHPGTTSRTIMDSIGLRIALSIGDLAEARKLVHSDLQKLADDPVPHRRTYGLALVIAVDLAEGLRPDAATLLALEKSHLTARRSARQGFSTFVLVGALMRTGRRARAARLLKEYVDVYRRESSPAPVHLMKLIESFPRPSASH